MPRPSPLRWPTAARVVAACAAVALAGCATPQAPGGGPVDATPPTLVATRPADGATGVADRTLVLTFSERLEPASARAVTVTPEGDEPARTRVRGRDLEVTLPPLRDSTTYVVSVGVELRDQRTVALRAPLTVALSTGPTIDRGRIAGVVRDPADGDGRGGLAVWAYALRDSLALPDPRAVAPDYRTQTGDDGAFALEYLRPGPYFVVAVADRNRNARADDGEAFAAPPVPSLRATADSAGAGEPPEFWVTTRDTIPPEPRRVRALSDRRVAVRFSEPVRLAPGRSPEAPTGFTLADSTTGTPVGLAVYQDADAPFEVLLESAAPLPPRTHVIRYTPTAPTPVLTDSAGVGPASFSQSVLPTAQPDTIAARFLAFAPAGDSVVTLTDGRPPRVRFSAPLDSAARAARVRLVVGDEVRPAALTTDDGRTYAVRPQGTALPDAFTVSVRDDDSTRTQRYVTLAEAETGGIVGRVESDAPVVVEVRPADGGEAVTVTADGDGAFALGRLAPGPYRVRLFADRDGDGQWSGGSLVPYRPAEPLRILPDPVTVRARWETELPAVDLRAPRS